jgi:hypothetical protein
MDARALIAAVQSELRRHSWDTFVDQPPSIAHAGKGFVVVGCPACRKKLHSESVHRAFSSGRDTRRDCALLMRIADGASH